MILTRLFTLARYAAHAVRSRVDCTVNLAGGPDEDRGVMLTAGRLYLAAVVSGNDPAPCDHAHDPDGPTSESWVVTPDQVRSWLELIEDGRTANEIMTEIELADVEDAVTG